MENAWIAFLILSFVGAIIIIITVCVFEKDKKYNIYNYIKYLPQELQEEITVISQEYQKELDNLLIALNKIQTKINKSSVTTWRNCSKENLKTCPLKNINVSTLSYVVEKYKAYIEKYEILFNYLVEKENIAKASETKKFKNNIQKDYNKFKTQGLLVFKIEYSSPAGRNHYIKKIEYFCEELEIYIQNKIANSKENRPIQKPIINKNESRDIQKPKIDKNRFGIDKSQCEKERKRLSPKLRFAVFKRDNYKCKICGRGQEDGVQLHCDHIVPIAKGGLTEMNNLQTLCQDCNLGKGTQDM